MTTIRAAFYARVSGEQQAGMRFAGSRSRISSITKIKGGLFGPPLLKSEVRRPTPFLRWRRSFAAFGASRLKVWLDHLLYSVIWFGRRHDLRQLLAFDDHLDLLSIQHFALDQRERNSDQHIPVGRQEFLGGVVTPFDQFLNFFVDLDRGGLAVIAMLRNLAAQKDL